MTSTSGIALSAADLAQAVDLLGEDLPVDLRERAHDTIARVQERDALDPTTIVAAFVGSTGSGKSSIFNAVCGAELAVSSVVRPTTRLGLAAVPDVDGGAGRLLDWLGIHQRVVLPEQSGVEPHTVLIDVPDIDSIDQANRKLADRLASRVDLLIWVVDPQKYADDVIHTQWIAPMASRAQSMLVVLNQIDRLTNEQRPAIMASLRELVVADGLPSPTIIPTSALTGEGIAELTHQLNTTAAFLRTQAVAREAQLGDLRRDLRAALDVENFHPVASSEDLARTVAHTIGHSSPIDTLVSTVQRAYRHRRITASGWIPRRIIQRFTADPLRRLHLSGGGSESHADVDLSSLMGSSGVSLALRRGMETMTQGRPDVWAHHLMNLSRSQAQTLTHALGRGIARTDLGMGTAPRWWAASSSAQWVAWMVALIGVVWLAGAHVIESYLLLPVTLPRWGEVPIPTALLIGGVTATIIIATLSAAAGWVGARRRGARARRALMATVERVVVDHVADPIHAEDERQRRIAALLGS